jgi:hypothetical protein
VVGAKRRERLRHPVGRRYTIINPLGKTMKTRLLLAVAGLALSFALSTFAQQNKLDPQLRERLVARIKTHTDTLEIFRQGFRGPSVDPLIICDGLS